MKKNVFLLLCFFLFLANSQAQNPSWSVKKLWHTSDVQRNGEKGIEFVADYVVNNMMGKELQGFVMIYDANKKYIQNPSASSNYRFNSNSIFTCSEKLRSNYVSTSVTNCKAFLPYSQLPRTTGNAVYYYSFFLRDATNNKWLSGNSDFGQFSLTWPFQKMLVNKATEILNDGVSYLEKEFYNDGTEIWNYHYKCTNYHYRGQCSLCGGTGYRISKQLHMNINQSYSNGTEGFEIDYSWSSFEENLFFRSRISQGTNIVSFNKKIIDNGNYWKLDNALISKDLKTLTINNKTYQKCSSQEYMRLYGKQIEERNRKASSNYVPPVVTTPITVGGTSSGSSSSRRECRRCLGTGKLPFSSDRYTTNRVGNTMCGKIDHSVCNYVSCHECHKNHCASLDHVICNKCYGRGYLE